MLFHNAKAEVKVYATDEGWIMEWEIKPPKNDPMIGTMISQTRSEPKTRGIKVFTSKKELLKAVENIVT